MRVISLNDQIIFALTIIGTIVIFSYLGETAGFVFLVGTLVGRIQVEPEL